MGLLLNKNIWRILRIFIGVCYNEYVQIPSIKLCNFRYQKYFHKIELNPREGLQGKYNFSQSSLNIQHRFGPVIILYNNI